MKNQTRQQLFNFFLNNPPSRGDTHPAIVISNVLQNLFENYGKPTDELTDETPDDLLEACDSETPIYNAELMDWLKDHPESLEEYQSNFGGLGELIEKEGIYKAIQCAYCFTLEQDASSAYKDMFDACQEASNR